MELGFQEIINDNKTMWVNNSKQDQDYEELKTHILNNEAEVMEQMLTCVS